VNGRGAFMSQLPTFGLDQSRSLRLPGISRQRLLRSHLQRLVPTGRTEVRHKGARYYPANPVATPAESLNVPTAARRCASWAVPTETITLAPM
jgi:hypothetical protein